MLVLVSLSPGSWPVSSGGFAEVRGSLEAGVFRGWCKPKVNQVSSQCPDSRASRVRSRTRGASRRCGRAGSSGGGSTPTRVDLASNHPRIACVPLLSSHSRSPSRNQARIRLESGFCFPCFQFASTHPLTHPRSRARLLADHRSRPRPRLRPRPRSCPLSSLENMRPLRPRLPSPWPRHRSVSSPCAGFRVGRTGRSA